MPLREPENHAKIDWKSLLPLIVIIGNSFSWYSSAYSVFAQILAGLQIAGMETLVLFGVFYVGVAGSAVLGAKLFGRRRKLSLFVWLVMGIFASLLLNLIDITAYPIMFAVSLFLGVSVGIGLPSCLAYFADATGVENRGLLGGIAWAGSGLGIFFIGIVLESLSRSSGIFVLAAWRAIGLMVFLLFLRDKEPQPAEPALSYSSILHNRTVVLCLLPWVMFCIVNWIEGPLLENLTGDVYSSVVFVEVAISVVSALVGGFFADLIGRKRLMITGFIFLGVEYAALSLLPEVQALWYLYGVLDGITWGMFSVVFFMVLWGDLAGNARKEEYYVIGGLPYLLAVFLSELIRPYAELVPITTAFSLASFFLFLAVLPLMYAPETLPEKKMKDRELKQYIDKAKKTKEKYP